MYVLHRKQKMEIFVVRLNPDTRSCISYSKYPTKQEYKKIHESSPMNGFHEAVNFLPEDGVVRGYLPPKHRSAMRKCEPFILVTITAKTAKIDGDLIIGIQAGCKYEGENTRSSGTRDSQSLGLSWHYSCPESLSLLLNNPISSARNLVLGKNRTWIWGPTLEINLSTLKEIINEAKKKDITSSDKNKLNRIIKYALDNTVQDQPEFESESLVTEALEEIEQDQSISATEKQQLIKARIGQGLFRDRLLSYWGKCCLTDCELQGVLRASHIKPWRECTNFERLDVFNGLLLSPNMDALFDKGLISFKNNGDLLISSKVSQLSQKILGCNSNMKILLQPNHKKYIEWHRENQFISVGA
jgi:HNH endonuclease